MATTIDLFKNSSVYGIDLFYTYAGEPQCIIPSQIDIPDKVLNIRADVINWDRYGMLLEFLSALSCSDIKIRQLQLYLPYLPSSRSEFGHLYSGVLASAVSHKYYFKIYTFDVLNEDVYDATNSAVKLWLGDGNTDVSRVRNVGLQHLDYSLFDEPDWVVAASDNDKDRARVMASSFDLLYNKSEEEEEGGESNYWGDGDVDLEGRVLIVSHCCDDGNDLVHIADGYYDKYPKITELQLYVSHGIFSTTPEVLEDWYSKVYTTDSFFHLFYEQDFPFVVEMPVPDAFNIKEVD